jgi:hypothetical protein
MKTIILSFDDARRDFYTRALPIIKKYNLTATLNVISDFILNPSNYCCFSSGNDEDIIDYFYEILPYFQDDRYIKENNCPVFAIYKPLDVPNVELYIELWDKLAKENGFNGIKLLAYSEESKFEEKKLLSKGFKQIISCRMYATMHNHNQIWRYINAGIRKILQLPKIIRYQKVIQEMVSDERRKLSRTRPQMARCVS